MAVNPFRPEKGCRRIIITANVPYFQEFFPGKDVMDHIFLSQISVVCPELPLITNIPRKTVIRPVCLISKRTGNIVQIG